MIDIRPEIPADYDEIRRLVRKSFETAEHTNGDEYNLVGRLRNSRAYIPELSLVAERNGKLAGHIMFTQIRAGNTTQLILAPLSVLPEYQKQGIGSALIAAGHTAAQKTEYEFSILVGHASYYPKFGYRPAAEFGLKCPFEVPPECFMAFNLKGRKTYLNAEIEFPPEFFEKNA